MKLTEKQIIDRVEKVESDMANYRALANRWESMWELQAFDASDKQAVEQDGMKQVTLPTPYNTVGLGMRLISPVPKILVPSKESTAESEGRSQKRQNWLGSTWQQVRRDTMSSPIDNAAWQSMVRARSAFDIRWIKKDLPRGMKDRFPILIRNLEPKNVGVKRGPLYVEYAYHKYDCPLWDVVQRYPKLEGKECIQKHRAKNGTEEWLSEEVCVIDFWYRSDGKVWNAVLIEDEFAIPPYDSKYPDIPIVVGYADTSMATDPAMRSLSILHGMDGLWQYQCEAMSLMATGLLWYFWPYIYAQNEHGEDIPDFYPRPGGLDTLPWGTKLDTLSVQPNMPLAQNIMSVIDSHMQQSSFPGVLYGEAPGELQAGYGVNLLSDAAKGRMRMIITNLELVIMQVNRIVLGLADRFGGPNGVDVWAMSEKTSQPQRTTLYKEDLDDGYYENQVILKPQLPEDDMQRLALGIQLVNAGLISARTFRDSWLSMPLPDDEENRIHLEQALKTPELAPKAAIAAIRAWYSPEVSEETIRGTPLEQFAKPPEPAGGPPPGAMPPGGAQPPPGPPPGPPGPVGSPIPGQMAGPPPPGPGGPLTQGGQPMQPPAGPMGPMGGGIPPELQGQITPEMLDMLRRQNPLLFAQLTGQPVPPQEELAMTGGLPPGVLRP